MNYSLFHVILPCTSEHNSSVGRDDGSLAMLPVVLELAFVELVFGLGVELAESAVDAVVAAPPAQIEVDHANVDAGGDPREHARTRGRHLYGCGGRGGGGRKPLLEHVRALLCNCRAAETVRCAGA